MKKAIAIVIAAFLLASTAYAFLPAVGLWMLGVSSGSLLVWDVGFITTGVLAGAAWLDCTYQITSCSDSAAAANVINGSSTSAAKPLTADFRPDSARPNPDASKFDDAQAPSRDPSPKASLPAPAGVPQDQLPASWTALIDSVIAAGGTARYVSYGSDGSVQDVQSVVLVPLDTTRCNWAGCPASTPPAGYQLMFCDTSSNCTESRTKDGIAYTAAVKHEGTAVASCDVGYALQNGKCALVDAASVKKPSTTPCQVLFDSTTKTFQFDSRNPNCDGVSSSLVGTDKGLRVRDKDGATTAIVPGSDGGFQVTKTNPDNSWKSIQTSPYDASQGGYPIKGTSSGVSSSSNPDPIGAGTGSGTGTGTGTGTGSGCGGPGQPLCGVKVDETGMPAPSAWSSATTALEALVPGYQSRVDGAKGDDHGISFGKVFPDLFFGAQHVQCQPIVYRVSSMNFGGQHVNGDMSFDFCNSWILDMIRQILQWFLYIGAVFYIWRRFMSAEVPGGE